MTAPDPSQTRALRRRRLHQRQTVILGTLVLILLGTLLIAWLMWANAIPSPFSRDFTSPPANAGTQVACPPVGAVTVGYSEITASVFNSTNVAGLAGSVGSSLASVGVNVTQTANWDEPYVGVGFLRTGVNGLEEAYTLQLALPGMIVTKDAREDALVDVVVGSQFASVGDLSAVGVGWPIALPPECLAPVPTEAPAEAPAGTAPAEGTAPPEGTAPTEAPAEG